MGGMSGALAPLRSPEPLASRHDLSRFSNDLHPSLDQWLRERARLSEGLSARTPLGERAMLMPVETVRVLVGAR